MLNIRLFRETPDMVRADLEKRGRVEKIHEVEQVIQLDSLWKELGVTGDALRKRRNDISREINEAKKAGKDAAKLLKEAGELPQKIKENEFEQAEAEARLRGLLMRFPNILHESVPVGADDSANRVLRTWGEPRRDKAKSHVDLIEEKGLADLERAAKISGARYYFLKNELVELDLALQKMALDMLKARGFTLQSPPSMMQRAAYEGVTDLGDFEGVMYKAEGEDEYFIATGEHPLVAQHMGEILEKLPIKYAGVSRCYRKEAGAHGKDQKGIFRVHEFTKVEQVAFCKPEDSWNLQEELFANAEEFFKAIEIPYRAVSVCTGDIGTVAARKYDIEAWMPAQQAYREVVSCSNCTDYQANRLKIRWRNPTTNKTESVHTLNSTMVATSRALVAILENRQKPDGSISIPKALQKYCGFGEIA
ncbi:serine--tRNA ligase [Candidatus Micrarchaeota archaeon CG1_02_60_51]|nr:MAG: serine--tRNA ligase [Candidatus Micrarchaeota archaeon CG1_02_60_51]